MMIAESQQPPQESSVSTDSDSNTDNEAPCEDTNVSLDCPPSLAVLAAMHAVHRFQCCTSAYYCSQVEKSAEFGQFNLLGIPNIAGLVSALLHTKSSVTYVVVLADKALSLQSLQLLHLLKVVFPIGKKHCNDFLATKKAPCIEKQLLSWRPDPNLSM